MSTGSPVAAGAGAIVFGIGTAGARGTGGTGAAGCTTGAAAAGAGGAGEGDVGTAGAGLSAAGAVAGEAAGAGAGAVAGASPIVKIGAGGGAFFLKKLNMKVRVAGPLGEPSKRAAIIAGSWRFSSVG